MKRFIFIILVLLFASAANAQFCPPSRVVSGTLATDLTTTTATDVIAAITSPSSKGIFLAKVLITNSSATATVVNVLNNSVSRIRALVPAGGGFQIDLNDYPLTGVAGQAWRIQAETAVTGLTATYIGCAR